MKNLNYILGYTSQKCPKVQFNSSGDFEERSFPFSVNICDDKHFIAIDTKGGLILFFT